MASLKLLLSLLVFTTTWATPTQPVLFHGTSLVILPPTVLGNGEFGRIADSTVLAANFFCYMVDNGYLSFGWYLPFLPFPKTLN